MGTKKRMPREDRDTQDRRPCEDTGRGWSGMFIRKGTRRIVANYQALAKKHETDSPWPQGGTNPTETLILNFQSLALSENKFLLC